MKNNKAYFSVDALASERDFDVWYADGDVFLNIRGPWTSERDRVTIFGRMGGEMGCIKPDPKALTYYLKLERWEYVFHTLRVFENYFVEGMKWRIDGSLANPPFDFVNEDTGRSEVHVQVTHLKGRGECFEVRARDVAALRIAVAAVIAMGIKEHHKGLSEGFLDTSRSRLARIKSWLFADKGITYEELQKQKELEG
ncbi:hypothetical protein GMI69_03435 [Eggerthellaceae bacterium zg-887]|uniref:hypothetical protein n=1 Tax=Xiamenia xianingshaonis TaxID=2682776 RepID=UPI0013EC3E5E|nr:hypothetical protein [Xiamenia xianingshaonis]NGM16912.1 hypothetical protein [Eggerthellaceae bacterium zg-893]NHM15725.1 hypothetical protein [Xiamenia xianingshaonis]